VPSLNGSGDLIGHRAAGRGQRHGLRSPFVCGDFLHAALGEQPGDQPADGALLEPEPGAQIVLAGWPGLAPRADIEVRRPGMGAEGPERRLPLASWHVACDRPGTTTAATGPLPRTSASAARPGARQNCRAAVASTPCKGSRRPRLMLSRRPDNESRQAATPATASTASRSGSPTSTSRWFEHPGQPGLAVGRLP